MSGSGTKKLIMTTVFLQMIGRFEVIVHSYPQIMLLAFASEFQVIFYF